MVSFIIVTINGSKYLEYILAILLCSYDMTAVNRMLHLRGLLVFLIKEVKLKTWICSVNIERRGGSPCMRLNSRFTEICYGTRLSGTVKSDLISR